MYALISIQLNTQEEASASLWSSLCLSLFLILCSGYISCHNLRRLLVLSFQLGEFVRICLNFPSLSVAWKVSQGNRKGYQRAHVTCFPFFRDCSPLLPDAQCLHNCFFIYFVHFQVGKKSGLVLLWLEKNHTL